MENVSSHQRPAFALSFQAYEAYGGCICLIYGGINKIQNMKTFKLHGGKTLKGKKGGKEKEKNLRWGSQAVRTTAYPSSSVDAEMLQGGGVWILLSVSSAVVGGLCFWVLET